MDTNELINRFRRPRTPTDEVDSACTYFTGLILDLVTDLDELTPDSREKSRALTHIEEALMWTIRAVERNGTDS